MAGAPRTPAVVAADAGADPGVVVVVAQHAAVAHGAVLRTHRAHDLARWAQLRPGPAPQRRVIQVV
eukprot:8898280-Pyramimonas_sp.AAC.1